MREARREYLNVNDETPLLAVARLFRESLPRGREIKDALCLAGENIDSYTPTGKFVQRARAPSWCEARLLSRVPRRRAYTPTDIFSPTNCLPTVCLRFSSYHLCGAL